MVKLVISQQARMDMNEILENVGEYTGSALSMLKLRNEFLEKFNFIALLPRASKLLPDGTRQTFCRRYRIIYKEIDNTVYILTIIHSSRLYPRP